MKHPLAFIPDKTRKPLFWALLAWILALMVISQIINAPLRTSAAPAGIISFELGRTSANAQEMISSWNDRAQLYAAFGLGFDYLFMPSYAFTIALACLLAAGRRAGVFSRIGAWLGWGAFLAAIFDALENIGLWHSLVGPVSAPWPDISYWCALFKFTLILFGIAHGLIGWILPKKI